MLRLKEIRKAKGVSQQKLADSIGVSRSAVAMWESGKSQPDNGSVLAIAAHFNITTDYLLGHEVEEDTQNAPILGDREIRLLELFGELNDEGKEKLIDSADDLVLSGKYTTDC